MGRAPFEPGQGAPMSLPELSVWQRIRIYQKAIPSDWQAHRSEIIIRQKQLTLQKAF